MRRFILQKSLKGFFIPKGLFSFEINICRVFELGSNLCFCLNTINNMQNKTVCLRKYVCLNTNIGSYFNIYTMST